MIRPVLKHLLNEMEDIHHFILCTKNLCPFLSEINTATHNWDYAIQKDTDKMKIQRARKRPDEVLGRLNMQKAGGGIKDRRFLSGLEVEVGQLLANLSAVNPTFSQEWTTWWDQGCENA